MDKIKPKQEGLADKNLRGLFVLTIGEVLTVRKRKGGMTVRVSSSKQEVAGSSPVHSAKIV
jgi:hypothetical protein